MSGAVEDNRAAFIGIQFGRLHDVGAVSRVDGIGVAGVCVVNGHGLLSDGSISDGNLFFR